MSLVLASALLPAALSAAAGQPPKGWGGWRAQSASDPSRRPLASDALASSCAPHGCRRAAAAHPTAYWLIHEKGVNISGGQNRRASLDRALSKGLQDFLRPEEVTDNSLVRKQEYPERQEKEMIGRETIQSCLLIVSAVSFMVTNVRCVSDGGISSTVYGSLEYRSSESFDGIVKQCQFQIKEKHKELQIGYADFSLESGEIIVRLKNVDTEEETYVVNLAPGSKRSETRILTVEPSTSFNLTIEGNNAVNGGIRVSYRAEQLF